MSFLPGLGLAAPPEAPIPVAPRSISLDKGTEWRFEVAFSARIEVKLQSGTAEIFGTELAPGQTYTLTGTKAAIWTWHGCKLEVVGECESEYVAEETPMVSYANAHFALENLRSKAALAGGVGPRVMLVGPENAGKTSLVKILTAYATKAGRLPLVVNLDSREGMLSVPGSLTATAFASIVDVEEGWGSSPISGPSPTPVKMPLVYFYGLQSAEENVKMFKPVTTRVALAVTSRFEEDALAKEAGCIIDTPGVIAQGKGGYEIIQHLISEFSVNVLFILGSERLYSDLTRRLSKQNTSPEDAVSLIKLTKSGGCVDRDESFTRKLRQAQIRAYFFGDKKVTLSPHTQTIDYSQLDIYKIADTTDYSSFLPGGETADDDSAAIFEKVEPSLSMQNRILAIMHADPNASHETIRDASVMGFVYVADVDEVKRKIRVLAPVSGRLPARAMVLGTWPEGVSDLVG